MNWHPHWPYLALAVICCVASVGIVFFALEILAHNGGTISDRSMYGIAAMAAAPCAMGAIIAALLAGKDRQP